MNSRFKIGDKVLIVNGPRIGETSVITSELYECVWDDDTFKLYPKWCKPGIIKVHDLNIKSTHGEHSVIVAPIEWLRHLPKDHDTNWIDELVEKCYKDLQINET